jgi:hypothetical protein
LSVGVIVISIMQVRWGMRAANTQASAMSSGWTISARSAAEGGLGRLSRIGVATSPGLMQTLRMPWMPSSAFKVADMARAPCLEAV